MFFFIITDYKLFIECICSHYCYDVDSYITTPLRRSKNFVAIIIDGLLTN